jgi:hypothetical protein
MNLEIPFSINDTVWFIHPKTLKAQSAKLKGIKTHITQNETNIKYNIDVPLIGGSEEVYVWQIYESKEALLKSL